MFGWFRRKDTDSFWSPRQRQIYSYWDGQKKVRADPLVLWKRIAAVGPTLSIDIKVGTSNSKDAAKAQDAAVEKIRAIFQVKPLVEGGLTENEACDLLEHFLAYCDQLKKNLKPSAISATVPLLNTAFLPEASQATHPGLACGSIDNGNRS